VAGLAAPGAEQPLARGQWARVGKAPAEGLAHAVNRQSKMPDLLSPASSSHLDRTLLAGPQMQV